MTTPEPSLLSRDALRSQALQRAQQRGAGVAKRRIALRWALWGTGRAARWAALPGLLLLLHWWWRHDFHLPWPG